MVVENNVAHDKLGVQALGDLVATLSLASEPLDIVYLDGYIWSVTQSGQELQKLNPLTGALISNYSLGFEPAGLTSDGTYFYISVEDNTGPNGTIFKLKKDGTIVSSITVALTDEYMSGLAWDGSNLWAVQEVPNALLKINPNTGAVLNNFTLIHDPAGLCWYDGLVWGVEFTSDKIYAYDPTDARVREVFDHPIPGLGDYGITENGTHFILSDWSPAEIYVTDLPTEVGEVWNQHSAPTLTMNGLDWNGTHYFTADPNENAICVLHDGTFQKIFDIPLSFSPQAVAVVGDYLFISEIYSPWKIYKYTVTGTYVAEYASVGVQLQGLTYDGTYIWANGADNNIYQLNVADLTEISHKAVGNYADLAWDYKNHVFWAVHQTDSKIYQLDASLSLTGVVLDTPYPTGEFGLCFNGEHLIHGSHSSDMIYKIIIGFPEEGGIPGFANYFLLLSVLMFIGVFFLLKQGQHSWREI